MPTPTSSSGDHNINNPLQPSFPEQILQDIEDWLVSDSSSPSFKSIKARITLYARYALASLTSLSLMSQNSKRTREIVANLRSFAVDKNLIYSFYQNEHRVYGEYQDYNLVFHVDEAQHTLSLTCKRLIPIAFWDKKHHSLRYRELLGQPVTVETITHLFTSNLHNPLPNPIKFDASGNTMFYEENDIWLTPASLLQLFETLQNFVNIYTDCCAAVFAMGGEAVAALEKIAANETHKLRSTAIQLLRDIALTTLELKEASTLLCPTCVTRCTSYQISLPQGEILTYFGCRVCGRSQKFLDFEGQVVVILDRHLSDEQVQDEQVLRVNWLVRRQLFDFEWVEIIRANDEAVERFAVQVGNDTDSLRKPRYQQMKCVVSPECRLSENTMRILRRMFGNVQLSNSGSSY